MDNDYITNDVDLIISRYIAIEKECFFKNTQINFKNNRKLFYRKMHKISKLIKTRLNILHPWDKLFEETMFLLYELYKIYFKQKKTKVPAMLLVYILKLSNSMRILFNSGYLESGLILHRTIIENIHLELVSITDLDFSKKLLDENENPNHFWHKNISKGKLLKKVQDILVDVEVKSELIIPKNDELETLSEIVHASVGSPIMMIEPWIMAPHLANPEPFGTINYHLTETYMRIIQDHLEYANANLKLILAKKTWFEENESWGIDLTNMLVNYNVVFKCFYEFYFPQYEQNKKLWNIDKLFE
jgi:hypothetical protein